MCASWVRSVPTGTVKTRLFPSLLFSFFFFQQADLRTFLVTRSSAPRVPLLGPFLHLHKHLQPWIIVLCRRSQGAVPKPPISCLLAEALGPGGDATAHLCRIEDSCTGPCTADTQVSVLPWEQAAWHVLVPALPAQI